MEESTVGIDYNQLKVQEKILFYEDIILFEDELADNGIAELRIKMVHILLLSIEGYMAS